MAITKKSYPVTNESPKSLLIWEVLIMPNINAKRDKAKWYKVIAIENVFWLANLLSVGERRRTISPLFSTVSGLINGKYIIAKITRNPKICPIIKQFDYVQGGF